jgi:hypothetical protein
MKKTLETKLFLFILEKGELSVYRIKYGFLNELDFFLYFRRNN